MKLACKAIISKTLQKPKPSNTSNQLLPSYFSFKMDSLIKQTRKKRPASKERTGEFSSFSREKIPARKSISFKEDKKKPANWLQKQFSKQMSDLSYDPISDMDHAAAVAATAYAITNLEETWLESYHSGLEDAFPEEPKSLSRSLSRRFSGQLSFKEPELNDNKLPTQKSPTRKSISVKKTPTFSLSLKGDHSKHKGESEERHERQRKPISEPPALERIQPPVRTRSERRPPPPSPPLLQLPPREIKSSQRTSRKDDYTADAWEKAELAKIKAKYEKLNRKIDLWETKKRDKARRKLDKSEQSEQEQRRRRGLQKFREDTEYIEQIAAGARAQAEKQRQSEELKVKEKATVIRRTGKLPGKSCLCF